MVGLTRLELVTPRLSSVCSNQLSYRPSDTSMKNNLLWILTNRQSFVKEVIQPQVPLRLPCYDFTPVIGHTVVTALFAVRLATSGATNSHGVTGGVYKAGTYSPRHSDPRLLAIPTSWSRVADSNPDYDRLLRLASHRCVATLCTDHCSTCVALAVRAMMT